MKKNLTILKYVMLMACMGLFQNVQAQDEDPGVRKVTIPHTTKAPVIDGVVDDVWENIPIIPIDTTHASWHWGTYPDNTNFIDFQAQARAAWKDNTIYLLVEVIDDQMELFYSWDSGDRMEVYLDPNNVDSTKFSATGANAYWWGVYPKNFDNYWDVCNGGKQIVDGIEVDCLFDDAGKDTTFGNWTTTPYSAKWWPNPALEYVTRVDSVDAGDGFFDYYYFYEFAIPLEKFGLVGNLEEGREVGLDIRIIDSDEGGNKFYVHYWAGGGWDNPSTNGSFIMGPLTDDTSVPLGEKYNMKLTLLQDRDNAQVLATEGIKTVDIYNILGSKVKSYRADGGNGFRFQTSDLKSGMYIINVNNRSSMKFVVQ